VHGALAQAELAGEFGDAELLTGSGERAQHPGGVVAKLARRAEKHYRCPQDVEWAIDALCGDVLLLQSRPETVWSRRPRPAAGCTADPITSMVQTLLNPSHGTPEGHGHGHG